MPPAVTAAPVPGPEPWRGSRPQPARRGRLLGRLVGILCAVALYGVALALELRASWLVVVVTLVWALTYLAEGWPDAEALASPRFAWLRTAFTIATVAMSACWAAASVETFSPLYAVVVVGAVVLAPSDAHRSPALLSVLVWVPLALRLTAAGALDGGDAIVLALVGVAFVGVALAAGRAQERTEARRAALDAEDARVIGRRRASGGLAAAMSIHDGMSGLVMIARTRAETSERYREEVAAAVAILLASAERVLGRVPRTIEQLSRELAGLAALTGSSVEVRVRGTLTLAAPDELEELFELAWEAGCNGLREGVGVSVAITISVRSREARVDCTTTRSEIRVGASGGGRGLRYALLRATLRHGTAGLLARPGGAHLWACWPRGPRRILAGIDGVSGALVAFPLALVLTFLSGNVGEGALALTALSFAVLLAMTERTVRSLDARTRAWFEEREGRVRDEGLGYARTELGPIVGRLDVAHRAASLVAVRPALRDLAASVSRVLRELESDDDVAGETVTSERARIA